MSDLKMSDVEVVDYPEWTLKDFLPSEMTIINRSGLPDPLSLEIVDKRNWLEVVNVYGEARDAKLVLKALTSHDSHVEQIAKQAAEIKLLRESLLIMTNNYVSESNYIADSEGCDRCADGEDHTIKSRELLAATEPKL